MPHNWLEIPTGTSDHLKDVVDDPPKLLKRVTAIAKDLGYTVEEMFWDQAGQQAYVRVNKPERNGDVVSLKALTEALGATDLVVLLEVQEADAAAKRAKAAGKKAAGKKR
jgi:hypothetical protein